MKKALALALALVMMFAVCVPAFAATFEGNKGNEFKNSADAVVKTDFGEETAEDFQKFTVTYPAETKVKWADTADYNVGYNVKTQLVDGYTLKVNVSKKDGKEMEMGTETLSYVLAGEVEHIITKSTASEDVALTVNVPENNWYVPVGEYQGNLTYAAEIIAPAP